MLTMSSRSSKPLRSPRWMTQSSRSPRPCLVVALAAALPGHERTNAYSDKANRRTDSINDATRPARPTEEPPVSRDCSTKKRAATEETGLELPVRGRAPASRPACSVSEQSRTRPSSRVAARTPRRGATSVGRAAQQGHPTTLPSCRSRPQALLRDHGMQSTASSRSPSLPRCSSSSATKGWLPPSAVVAHGREQDLGGVRVPITLGAGAALARALHGHRELPLGASRHLGAGRLEATTGAGEHKARPAAGGRARQAIRSAPPPRSWTALDASSRWWYFRSRRRPPRRP